MGNDNLIYIRIGKFKLISCNPRYDTQSRWIYNIVKCKATLNSNTGARSLTMLMAVKAGAAKCIWRSLCPALPLVHRHRRGSAGVALVEGLFLGYLKSKRKLQQLLMSKQDGTY